jgi:hypothetical protein
MEVGQWLVDNWYVALQSTGIVGGLLFTAFSLRSETKTRRIANLLVITQNHREIWKEVFERPALKRVMDPAANLTTEPVDHEEELFVHFLVLHLNSVFHAMKDDVFVKPDGLRQDIRRFFSLPIPFTVWERIKVLQDDEFVRFVEKCRSSS